jgi:hypothetical protein
MATWSKRTIVSRRTEYTVPAPPQWGAGVGDIQSAIAAAWAAFRREHNLPEDAVMYDNALQFFPRDDEIVISFTIEQEEKR